MIFWFFWLIGLAFIFSDAMEGGNNTIRKDDYTNNAFSETAKILKKNRAGKKQVRGFHE